MAWNWLRRTHPGDAFGRPTAAAEKTAQRWTDNGHCPAGIKHTGRCRHR